MYPYKTDKENLEKKIVDVDKKYQIRVVQWLKLFWVQKLVNLRTKISDNSKNIITQEFNKPIVENFAAISKQADLVNKTDFDNKLISFNRRFTSNKTKDLEVHEKLNSLMAKDWIFFLDRIILQVMMDLIMMNMMMMNCFCGMVDRRMALILIPASTIVRDPQICKSLKCREQDLNLRRTSDILTILNFQHVVSRVWTWTEPEFRLGWMKSSNSNNHCTNAPEKHICGSTNH